MSNAEIRLLPGPALDCFVSGNEITKDDGRAGRGGGGGGGG